MGLGRMNHELVQVQLPGVEYDQPLSPNSPYDRSAAEERIAEMLKQRGSSTPWEYVTCGVCASIFAYLNDFVYASICRLNQGIRGVIPAQM